MGMTKDSKLKNQVALTVKSSSLISKVPEYIKTEMFLEGSGYFTPSSKRIKNITKKEKVVRIVNPDGSTAIKKGGVFANSEYGLPITSDFDYYRAFLKICSEDVAKKGYLDNYISVSTTKLLKYTGKSKGSKEWKEIRNWFDRMGATYIKNVYNSKKREYDTGRSHKVFDNIMWRGEKDRNGNIVQVNTVKLSDWFLENYNDHYVSVIDLKFHNRLRKPISKSLYPILERGWYASENNPFKKNYRSLCSEFLLKENKHLSKIKQQFDPAHKELQKEKFLEKWEYKTAQIKSNYVIIYYPGEKFFQDQKARLKRKQTADQIAIGSKTSSRYEPLSEEQEYLVEDILKVCKDSQNRVAYEKIVREKSEQLIRSSLTETRMAIHEGRIKKTPGAYFTDTIKQLERLRANVK